MCMRKSIRATLFMSLLSIFFILCIRNKSFPVEPKETIITNGPVEDTTRIYLKKVVDLDGTVIKIDTMKIYPKAVFVRFNPGVSDTVKIKNLLRKFNLRIYSIMIDPPHQVEAVLCVTDNRRAEYHFTPYGKEGFNNFGADSLVEYAFGVFGYGYIVPKGEIFLSFKEGTPETRIDSLIVANGLRLISSTNEWGIKYYMTLITPRARKNVLDLAYELQPIPFVVYIEPVIGIMYEGRIICE